jgi:hypothetical protein
MHNCQAALCDRPEVEKNQITPCFFLHAALYWNHEQNVHTAPRGRGIRKELKMDNTTQIVWNGCDAYVEATNSNSETPNWPIQGNDGKWRTEEFPGQRVVFDRGLVHFAFRAVEMNKSEIPVDADGEMILDGLFVTEDSRIFRAELQN